MNEKISCTYIGHATTLINICETRILTDPHFGKRTLWAKRKYPLPINPGNLPDLSCILLSHTHCDHLDISSYKYISCGVPIIVPEGCERAVGAYLTNPVIELSHFSTHELADGTEITASPVLHAQSHIVSFGPSKSNAYLIRRPESESYIYFCADSAYGPHFRETGNLGHIDLALLPIGGYEPRWFMHKKHMTPAESVNAFEDLKARHMIPIHYGTFRLSLENPDAPIAWLNKIIEERPDLAEKIHMLKPGEEFVEDMNAESSKIRHIHVA
jgi:L-ascorbate metabolism protein UlaG (beta-lactamase superfamily)